MNTAERGEAMTRVVVAQRWRHGAAASVGGGDNVDGVHDDGSVHSDGDDGAG